GYRTTARRMTLEAVDDRLRPCLFALEGDGRTGVLVGRTEAGPYAYIDGEYRPLTEEEARAPASVYFVARMAAETGERQAGLEKWFWAMIGRFRSSVRQLCLISLVLNILAIVTPLFVMTVYDKMIGQRSLTGLAMLAAGAVFALTIEAGLRVLKARLLSNIAGRVDFLLGVSTFQKLLKLPLSYTERSAVGSQISRLKEFEGLRDFFTGPAASAATELPFVLIMVGLIAILAGPLALVPLVAILAYALIGGLWVRRSKEVETDAARAGARHQEMVAEVLGGLRTIKNCSAEAGWFERLRGASAIAAQTAKRAQVSGAVTDAFSQAVMSLSAMSILALGALLVMQDAITIGALIATMALTWRILGPIQSAFLAGGRLTQIRGSIRQINRLMALREEPAQLKSGLLQPAFQGKLEFRRVSFRYSKAADPALAGVSLSVSPGEALAIAGACGSGKTTLLKLMMRLYAPQAGSILLDGVDLRQINRADLHQHIVYVPQTTDLFYGSVAQNLTLAEPSAARADLEAVAERVGILDVIQDLPDGFDTRLGDRRTEALPKGFVRRLGLARALLSPARIVLFDEPEQNLDAAGDELVLSLMKEFRGVRTQICVTHRPSYIRAADRAVFMRRGMIEAIDTPDAIVAALCAAAEGDTR
ncbi:MAG: ABC transporter transmembrane domain-containing protein, partial [Pseudomonadota bacterium]